MRQHGEQPSYVHPDNLIEFTCYDCRHEMERRHSKRIKRVLHRYSMGGTLIETLVVEGS
jgi:hypothetical protein